MGVARERFAALSHSTPAMELDQKAASLPAEPGVYLFKDALGNILYVGKSSSLRNRVKSYFLESRWMDAKTGSLVREIADHRLHRRGQRARSPGARKQPDQAVQAEIQRAAARRQDLPVHSLHGVREISARVRDAAPGQGRLDLLRTVFPAQPGVPDRSLHPQDVSRSVLHGGPDARAPAALPAILHSPLPRAVRSRPDHGRKIRGSGARHEIVSRRPPPRPDGKPRIAHDGGFRHRTLRASRGVPRPAAHAFRNRGAPKNCRRAGGRHRRARVARGAAAGGRESFPSSRRARGGPARFLLGGSRGIRAGRISVLAVEAALSRRRVSAARDSRAHGLRGSRNCSRKFSPSAGRISNRRAAAWKF